MAKIGICLYGHCRTYGVTAPSLFLNVVEPLKKAGHEVKVYQHTWSTLSNTRTSWWGTPRNDVQIATALTPILPKVLEVFYKHDKLLIEHDRTPIKTPWLWDPVGWSAICTFESKRKVYEMAEADKCDFMLFTRPDVKYISQIKAEDMTPDKLLCPPNGFMCDRGQICDIWHYSNAEIANTITKYLFYVSSHFMMQEKKFPHFEDYWTEFVKSKGVKVAIMKLDYKVERLFPCDKFKDDFINSYFSYTLKEKTK